MVDTTLNPTTPVTNGDIVTTSNPLPVYLVGGVPATSITVGTTVIASGTNGRVLYDNSGVLGEFALGTGVQTALGVNTGSAGAFVLFNGALGTPSSGVLTNATGLPVGSITGLGTGVATWLATPSSANLASAVTDETGSGALVFGTAPTLTGAITGNVAYASLPSASSVGGKTYWVTDAGTKGSLWVSDGTRWKPVNNVAPLASVDATGSNIANSETIVFQYLLPTNLWQTHDRVRIWLGVAKSGTTDTCGFRVRMGTAGTTADTTVIGALTIMAAGDRQFARVFDFRLESATSVQPTGNNANPIGFGGANSTSAYATAVTITSAAANPIYVSVSINSSSTNDTVAITNGLMELIATAN